MSHSESKFLLIEDDPFLIEWIDRLIGEHFPEIHLVKVCSERDFLIRREELASQRFKGIILDVMLPWEDGVDITSTEHADPRGEYFDAGLRILEDIVQTPLLAVAPVLVHTVNDRSAVNLSPMGKCDITFLRKDEPDSRLVRWIDRTLARN